MESKKLNQCGERLRNRWPLIGPWLRRQAVRELSEDRQANAVPLLVQALADADEQVRTCANGALRALQDGEAIDKLCGIWMEKRDAITTAILRERRYVARKPAKLRVLTSLLINEPEKDAECVPFLIEALSDADEQVRTCAHGALRALKDGEAIDKLCGIWMEKRDAITTAILRERRYVARKPAKLRVLTSLLVNEPAKDAECVPFLIEALSDPDEQVRTCANGALRALQDGEAIDKLCGIWMEKRDAITTAILRERRYVARKPAKLRVLTSLLVNEPAKDAECVPFLIEALSDPDEQVRTCAHGALRALKERDAVDVLCRQAIKEPSGAAAKICVEARKRPSDHDEACLLLFVTRQLDEYFQEDFEFQGLRQAYDRASDEVKTHVMEIVRSGDRRCLGFFGRRKPLSECTESEIQLAIDSARRHNDWPRLFRAFQELPMKHGFPLIEEFRKSGWEPEPSELKSLYRAMLSESAGSTLPPVKAPAKETSSLFEKWLSEGRGGELSRLGEGELLQRLASASPSDGVKMVAALAGKAAAGGGAARAVSASGHWLVRLAGHATGLCGSGDIAQDEARKDGNHWVDESVRSVPVIEFWPLKATPEDLDRLNAAPRELFIGKYGAVRRVLRLLLAHRVTTPEMIEVEFEAGEFAGEFEQV